MEISMSEIKQRCKSILSRFDEFINREDRPVYYWTCMARESHKTPFETLCENGELFWSAPDLISARFIGGLIRWKIDGDMDDKWPLFGDADYGDWTITTSDGKTVNFEVLYRDEDSDVRTGVKFDQDISDQDKDKFLIDFFNKDDTTIVKVNNVYTPGSISDLLQDKKPVIFSKYSVEDCRFRSRSTTLKWRQVD